MADYLISTHVAAPPAQVFALWTDLARMGEWVGGITGVTDVSEEHDELKRHRRWPYCSKMPEAAIGRPVVADAAATRRIRPGSRSGRASRARMTSPLNSSTPSSSGLRTGRRNAGESPARQRIARGAQAGVDVEADGAGGVGEHARQIETVADAQRRADLVGVLRQHLVAAAARTPGAVRCAR